MTHPLCFVLMPFGQKPGGGGSMIDFDQVYAQLIAPAIAEAGLEPLRADEEKTGGVIHKPMYERLVLCEYAVADLTTGNPNVFYELGIRHAVRPFSTVPVFAEGQRLPFDVQPLRGLPYQLGADGKPSDVARDKQALVARLQEAREAQPDSPFFQLVEGMKPQPIDHEKTDVFRDQIEYSASRKEQLAEARATKTRDAVFAVEQELGSLEDEEAAVVIDLFLSYRAVESWPDMIRVADAMSKPLAHTAMVQEQLGLALNRNNEGDAAERVLRKLLERRGPSSETFGILGRVYKDRWEAEKKSGSAARASGFLEQAIDTYVKGFETDWRDAYPGINAVTLMEVKDPPDERKGRLLPVVQYAVERKIAAGRPDYWDHATQLELFVLGSDEPSARHALGRALAAQRETWESKTTARNLRLILEARQARGAAEPWLSELIDELE